MKPVNPRLIVLAISLALIAVLAGCSGGESRNSTATVYVQGAGSSASRYVAASAGGSSAPGFESGEVIVSGENVTDRLSSSDVETGQAAGGANDKLFEATVENVPSVVTLEVEPKRGFVFNEWRLNTHRVFTIGNLSWSEYIDLMLSPAERHSETLVVPADKAEYYIATFERGYYIDLESTSSEGIGTKSSPYGSFDEAISAMKSARFIDEEITFKVAGSDPSEVLTLSEMASIHTNGDELEELRVLGGYDSSWNKTGRSSFRIDFSGFSRGSELEDLVFSSIKLEALSLQDMSRNMDLDDIEFFNVEVGDITGNPGVLANLIITGEAPAATYVNCVVESSVPGAAYIHSLIKEGVDGNITGFNNIIVSGTETKVWENNLYVPAGTEIRGYLLVDPPAEATSARMYDDDIFENVLDAEVDDDLLETDISGRSRSEDDDHFHGRGPEASYGPYEYLDIRELDDDWFDGWDDDWDD